MNTTTNIVVPAYFPKSAIKLGQLQIAIVDVSPLIAKYWLDTYNVSNRPMSRSNIAFISAQMISGQWVELNGDSISFLPDGTLNDGQNRLKSVVETGKTIKFLVIIGVDQRSFKTKDTGKKRTGADVLAIEGYTEYALMAATCRFLIAWNNGKYSNVAESHKGMINNSDIVDFAKENKTHLTECCRIAQKFYKSGDKLIKTAWVSSLYYLFSKRDVKATDNFLFRLCTGSNIEFGSTMYYLRKKLREVKDSDMKKIPAIVKLALIIKTWNCERTGKNKKRLTFSPSGGEKFPTII